MPRYTLLTLVIVIAVAGAGVWWLLSTPIDLPAATVAVAPAAAPAPKIPPAPKPAEPPKSRVELPTAPPVPLKPEPVVKQDQPPAVDPQAELSTVFPDIARRLRDGDLSGLMNDYMPPEQLAKMPAEARAQMEQQMQQPEAKQMMEMMAQMFDGMKDQTPEMNAAGDEATYQMTPPAGMMPPDFQVPSQPIHFKKIDGRWYVNESAGGGF